MKFFIYSLVGCLILFNSAAEVKMDGSSKVVFEPANAIIPEKTAYQEINHYLKRIFKKTAVASAKKSNKIIIGYHKDIFKVFTEQELKTLGEEDYRIRSDRAGNIYIVGGRPRGTLFGVYHFLDELLGVHWYTPEFEHVPEYQEIILPDLNLYERPAFSYRKRPTSFGLYKKTYGAADPAWCARNRFNDIGYSFSAKSKITMKDLDFYGLPVFYAPPSACHTMPILFPPMVIFKDHPDWIAMKNGKRELHKKTQHIGYCLSSKSLLDATIRMVRKTFRSYPAAKYISISEGDGSGSCECPDCTELVKKYGGHESALWLNFINQIADAVKDEFPDKLVGTLAYTHTAEPPENMKARDNVLIWVCAWSIWRGLPYDDPRNDRGIKFMKMLKKWNDICRNVHVWDYMCVYSNLFCPIPDLRRNIDSLQAFRKTGTSGILEQGLNIPPYESGAPFKFWLYARAAWNPDGCNYEKLLKTFCTEYYGKKAGSYIYNYWIQMEQANLKQGFYKIGMGGWLGNAPHAKRENILRYDRLFKKALAEEKDPVYLDHIKIAYIPVQLIILRNWKEWSRKGEMPDSLERYYSELKNIAEKFPLEYNESHVPLKKMLPSFYRMAELDFIATSSGQYGGSSPYAAFDQDETTNVSFGNFSGWLQIEFPLPREINDLTIVFSRNHLSATYSVSASTDGKKWIVLIPRRTISRKKHGKRFLCGNRIQKTEKIKYLRISVHEMTNRHGKPSWTGIFEVYFNSPASKDLSTRQGLAEKGGKYGS